MAAQSWPSLPLPCREAPPSKAASGSFYPHHLRQIPAAHPWGVGTKPRREKLAHRGEEGHSRWGWVGVRAHRASLLLRRLQQPHPLPWEPQEVGSPAGGCFAVSLARKVDTSHLSLPITPSSPSSPSSSPLSSLPLSLLLSPLKTCGLKRPWLL